MSTDQIARITKAGLDRMERDLAAEEPPPTDTVYAHVERTVHALLSDIERRIGEPSDDGNQTFHVKNLAEAVQALSSWPQFNPMNAHEQYEKLAEYEVQKAIRFYQNSPKVPACNCGVGVQAPLGFHMKNCKAFTYALETSR